jgi:hypothetical protein
MSKQVPPKLPSGQSNPKHAICCQLAKPSAACEADLFGVRIVTAPPEKAALI